jgi:hypothetical protein
MPFKDCLDFSDIHAFVQLPCVETSYFLYRDSPQKIPAILFKAEFSQLSGSGAIKLASTVDQTGIRVSLEKLDLSRMNTKPFEPKLPLPEAFESELMRTAIAQLQPVINQYLTEKPLYLPDHIAPLAASPLVNLWSTGNGTGYAEVLSYCTCDEETNTPFAICDKRSNICTRYTKKKLFSGNYAIMTYRVIH